MLARVRAPADPERCRRQPLPEETEADDDAAEAERVQPAQPRARPAAWGLSPRRLAALAAAFAGTAAVVGWGRAKGVRAASPMPPKWRKRAVGLIQAKCTEQNQNCSATRCCVDPALTCFEKDETWAACIEGCEPGVHEDWDPPGHQTPWLCTPLSSLDSRGADEDDDDDDEVEDEGAAVEDEDEDEAEAGAEAPASCEDLVDDWQDAWGTSCQNYEEGQLCTGSGNVGSGRNGSGGLPVLGVAVLGHGLSAADACCACGGGTTKDSTWSLVHRDWRCSDDASMLYSAQAPDKMRLSDCGKFCVSYRYMEFWTSRHAGICQCHSECSADGQKTHPDYHSLVYKWDVSS